MLLASNFTKNELLHRYFSCILISNLGTTISQDNSEWLFLFAKLLKRRRSTLSTARQFHWICADSNIRQGQIFFRCRHFCEEEFFVHSLFSECLSYENFVEIKNLKCQGIMLIIIQLQNLMACFLFLFLSFFIFFVYYFYVTQQKQRKYD